MSLTGLWGLICWKGGVVLRSCVEEGSQKKGDLKARIIAAVDELGNNHQECGLT